MAPTMEWSDGFVQKGDKSVCGRLDITLGSGNRGGHFCAETKSLFWIIFLKMNR